MSIAGMRGTDDWGTDERPRNFRESILFRDPNGSAPLTALMSKMRSEVVNDSKYSWWEETLQLVRLQANGGETSVSTEITVDSGALGLVSGDLLLIEKTTTTSYDHELVRLTANPTIDTSIPTVTRGARNTTAAAIPDNAFLTKIGSVNEEGSDKRTAVTRNPTKYENYLQIFKTSYNISKSAAATYARTGDALKNDKKRKMFDHAVDQELAFLFGIPYEDTGANGDPMTSTGGLLNFLSAMRATDTTLYGHCITILTAATFTEDDLLDAMHPVFDWNAGGAGNTRLVFAGNGAINEINKEIKGSASTQINYQGTIKSFGMQLRHIAFPQGDFYMKSHPLMNTHPRYKNGMFVINPAGIRHRYLTGRDTSFEDNIQTPGADRIEGQWIGEVGAEFHHLPTMQYIEFQ